MKNLRKNVIIMLVVALLMAATAAALMVKQANDARTVKNFQPRIEQIRAKAERMN